MRTTSPPIIVGALIVANILAYIAQMSTPGLTEQYALIPALAEDEPYRLVTGGFLHSPTSMAHIMGNMASLWFMGRLVEQHFGHLLFLVLYALSLLGGSLAAVALTADPNTIIVGASGAVFGVLAASTVVSIFYGGGVMTSLLFLGGNIAYGFAVPGISWQAHVGGAAVGLVFALAVVPVKRALAGRASRGRNDGPRVGAAEAPRQR